MMGGVTRQARKGVDKAGLLLDSRRDRIYLRRNNTARYGHHFFWLKTDDASGTDHIATIRVLARDGTVMDSTRVCQDDFLAAKYQDFGLKYTVAGTPGNFPLSGALDGEGQSLGGQHPGPRLGNGS